MKEVAVCIVVNDLYYPTRFCIENLISNTKAPMRLYFLNNCSKDARIVNYLVDLQKKHIKQLQAKYKNLVEQYGERSLSWGLNAHAIFHPLTQLSICEAYNFLIKRVLEEKDKHDLICIFPINHMVNKNWLEDLISSNEQVEDAGITSIRTGDEKTFLSPLLHKHPKIECHMKNVWLSENNVVEGVTLFNKSVLDRTGLFDEKLIAPGYEQQELAFRVSSNGYKNYYITKQTCIRVDCENEILVGKKNDVSAMQFREEIERMFKERNFKK